MPAPHVGDSSRYSIAFAGDVDYNPLLATFVLSGNPLESLQVFVSQWVPYANNEPGGGQLTGGGRLKGNSPGIQPAVAMEHLGLSLARASIFQENV